MKSNISASLSVAQLKRALEVRQQIETLEQELSSILSDTPITTVAASPSFAPAQPTVAPKGKRVMSASWKAKIAAAQHRRWAKVHAEKTDTRDVINPMFQPLAKKTGSSRKPMSAKGRANIGAAVKARYAARALANKKS